MLNVDKKAAFLSAMANGKRLQILQRLIKRPYSVRVLAGLVGLSHSAICQHLAILRREKLVKRTRNADVVYYTSNDKRVFLILRALKPLVEHYLQPEDEEHNGQNHENPS